jgi:hypothetical protein
MSNTSEKADILLKISSNLTDIQKAQEEFRKLKETGTESAVKLGGAFAVANQAISAALQGVKGFFKGTLVEGVKLNTQLETTARGMAAVMRQHDPGKFGDFKSAVQTSAAMLEELRLKAAQAGLGIGETVSAFQDAAPVFSAVRVPVKQQTALLVESARAMQTLGVDTASTRRELMALFTGHGLERSRLAMGLGITEKDLSAAREQGRLVELITQRLDEFNRGAGGLGDTLETVEAKLKNAISNQAVDATKELTESYKELLKAVTEMANAKETVTLMGLLSSIPKLWVDAGTAIVQEINFSVREAESIRKSNEEAFQSVKRQIDGALTLEEIDNRRVQLVEKLALEETRLAKMRKDYEVKKTFAVIAGHSAFVPSDEMRQVEKSVTDMKALLAEIDENRDAVVSRNKLEAEKKAAAAAEAVRRESEIKEQEAAAKAKQLAEGRQQAAADWLKKNRAAYEEQIESAKRAMLADEEQLKKVNELITKREQERDAAIAAAGSEDEQRKISLESEKKLLDLRKQMVTLQERIAKAAERAAAEAKRLDADAKKKQLEDLKAQLEAQEKTLQVELNKVSVKQANNEADRFKTNNEKRVRSIALLTEERDEMIKLLAVLEAMKGSVGDDEAAQKLVEAQIGKLQDDIRKKNVAIGAEEGKAPLVGLEKLDHQLRQMREDSDATFDVMNAGFQGMASGISDALVNAQNLGDGFKKVLGSIAKGIADAVIQIISMKIAMAAVNGIGGMFGGFEQGGYTTPKGFADGGLTPAINTRRAVGVVHESEWVAPKWMVRSPNYGPMITALENARIARRGFAGGGATTADTLMPVARAGAGGGGDGDVFNFHYTFQSGVTRAEVAALLPVLKEQTIAAVSDRQRRRKM